VPRARRAVPKHRAHHTSTHARKSVLTCRERAAHTSGPSCAPRAATGPRRSRTRGATCWPSSRPCWGRHGAGRARRGGRAAGAARHGEGRRGRSGQGAGPRPRAPGRGPGWGQRSEASTQVGHSAAPPRRAGELAGVGAWGNAPGREGVSESGPARPSHATARAGGCASARRRGVEPGWARRDGRAEGEPPWPVSAGGRGREGAAPG
jgi:hypothetical protein